MADGVLQDKVVLVNGAGRGIGAEIAKLAAREGAKVVVNDLGAAVDGKSDADIGPAQQIVADIEAEGGEAVVNGGDISKWDDAQEMVQQAVDTFGQIDGVVNVAGILRDVIFHKMTEDDWDSVINVPPDRLLQCGAGGGGAFPQARIRRHGALHLHSGLVGNVGQANYAAAKMGIVGLSQSIALDMQRFRRSLKHRFSPQPSPA